MMTVFDTPFAFMSARSDSGVASRSGTRAPAANGNAGSCFHTCTCESMIGSPAVNGIITAPRSSVRREILRIDRFEAVHDVRTAALVARARPGPRDVEVHDQPSVVRHRLQHAVAAGE